MSPSRLRSGAAARSSTASTTACRRRRSISTAAWRKYAARALGEAFCLGLAIFLLGCTSAIAQPLTFGGDAVGGPAGNARGELFLPSGPGPFPAVVVLHGCNGVGRHERIWAEQLTAWGYAAMVVDSFRPRDVTTVCNQGRLVPAELQALDGFNAANYLRAQPKVGGKPIGVIGFSHGGWAVLKAVLADLAGQAPAKPFAAAVAFYPGCDPPRSALATDTLILIGEADDWTPVDRCVRWRDAVERNGHSLQMKTYPGALHSFDAPSMPHSFAGHYIGRDPQAAADALAETRKFFDERLALPR